MKILFLDDMSDRHDLFRMRNGDHEVLHCTNATQAILALDKEIFDLVHLDHDLADAHYEAMAEGGFTDQDYAPGTGMDVVDHIVGMPTSQRPLAVIVHSWNIARAPEMVARLRDAGISAKWVKFR